MIHVSELNFIYPHSGKHAIQGMSFDVNRGEVFGFLGPSGAGKTTTQRLLIGLLRHYTGSVRVMGTERSAWGRDFYERVGVAFDFPNLFLKLTAIENLRTIGGYYSCDLCDFDHLLDRVGLLPDRDKRVEGFSKGMKMRLNFVRSLMHNPDLLFLDEPTSGLDPMNAHIVKEMILEQKAAGKTVFITTHNMSDAAQLCDRVAFVVDGKIVVIGAPRTLMIEHGERTLHVEHVQDGERHLSRFALDHLAENSNYLRVLENNQILTMHSCEATLEDIFIKLTGRRLLCD